MLIVTGCYAQLKPDEVAAIEGVDLVLGSNEKFELPQYLLKLEQSGSNDKVHCAPIRGINEYHPSTSKGDRTRFFLKIQDGCDYFCSYCSIPMARGKSRNGTIAATVAEAQKALDNGAKEIVLAGVNIGDFGKSTGETFLQLIRALDQIESEVRFRISSIEPNLLTDEIIEFVAQSRHFAPHFHVPLQSGSDSVLKLMKRRYDTALFAHKVERIRTILPHAFIGVDVIVGVRGETAELFEEARQFIQSLDISQLHVFTYSERAGTKMLEIDHIVPVTERKKRSKVLQDISIEKTKTFYAQHAGYKGTVLWESEKKGTTMHGFTENYIRVEAPYQKELINTFQPFTV